MSEFSPLLEHGSWFHGKSRSRTARFITVRQECVGYLIYTADGYMSAEIMDPDRRQSNPDFPLEMAAAQTLPDSDRARPTAPMCPIAEPTRLRAAT